MMIAENNLPWDWPGPARDSHDPSSSHTHTHTHTYRNTGCTDAQAAQRRRGRAALHHFYQDSYFTIKASFQAPFPRGTRSQSMDEKGLHVRRNWVKVRNPPDQSGGVGGISQRYLF